MLIKFDCFLLENNMGPSAAGLYETGKTGYDGPIPTGFISGEMT